MAHVIPDEGWATRPKTVVYFCGALPDLPGGVQDGVHALSHHGKVRRNALTFLQREVRHLWPNAFDPHGSFRWDLLADPGKEVTTATGPLRFSAQYWRANVNPSDRHVLALPGSLRHRISPLDRTYDNLTIAGDWTDCGFNEGCVEAAVMSGRLAAHALSGAPALAEITGFDHP
jgi:hypothetical protein